MGGEYLFEGLDGAEVSDEILEFIFDAKRQSGSPIFDNTSNYVTQNTIYMYWIGLLIAFALNFILKDKRMLAIKFIAINHL